MPPVNGTTGNDVIHVAGDVDGGRVSDFHITLTGQVSLQADRADPFGKGLAAAIGRSEPPPGLRLARPSSAAAALGLAVGHLMTRPAFAALPFGSWSRVLVGQINRGHYHFVADGTGRAVGFLGWAVTGEQDAESWLAGRDIPDAAARDGDCIVINAWSADHPAVNRLLLAAARRAIRDKQLVYFKRHYKDGRTRPMRLAVNDFVAGHIGRGVG